MRGCALLICLLFGLSAQAAELALNPKSIAPDTYAVIGDLGGQTYENDGLNCNLGFVVTPDGVLVINSGPSMRVARALHAAIKKITAKPVKWVVNVNNQNHYWLGNGYFRSIGAKILAHREADHVMHEAGEMQLASNRALLKEKADDTVLAYPTELFDDKYELSLGSTTVQFLHLGHAHTPGDVVIWLPRQKIVFSGDIVYTERLLAVIPLSHSGSWVQAFDRLAKLDPKIVVPGHGRPTDMQKARRDTRDYLVYLRAEVKIALDRNDMPQDAEDKIDQSRFKHLANFEQLAKRNVNRIYLELEKESF